MFAISAIAVAVAAVVSGCGTGTDTEAEDYGALLIADTELAAPGDPAFTAAPPVLNPFDKPGAATSFTSADGVNVTGDTISILPDAESAGTLMQASVESLSESVIGNPPTPVSFGDVGVLQSGTSPDGTTSVTVALFTRGSAPVTLQFDGPLDDPVVPEYVALVAQKQDDAIVNGLPG